MKPFAPTIKNLYKLLFLSNKLIYSSEPEGIILEIKEELGLGHTANIILINGSLNVSDEIIVGKKSANERIQ